MAGPARLTVLGSGTSVPLAGRASSAYLLEASGQAWLIDLGPGVLHRAACAGCDLGVLAGVLLTHVHPDHCADLVALAFALNNPSLPPRPAPVELRGHPEAGLLLARLRNAWPRWLAAGDDRLRFRAISAGPLDLPGGLVASAHVVAHHGTSLGYRFTLPDGFVVAFSGDATEGGDLLALAAEADLLVLEAAGPDEAPIPGHLTPRRAGRLAQACRVRHLLLTHFYPQVLRQPIVERARETFEGPITLAHDGLLMRLSR